MSGGFSEMSCVLHMECRRCIHNCLICGESCACLFALEKSGHHSLSYILETVLEF